MTTKMKFMALGLSMALFTGCSSVEDLIEDYIGDDEDQYSSSALYLKDSSGAGVAGIEYSCDGGYTSEGDLTTSGTTSSSGDMIVDYWPGYDLQCTITPIDAPELYLHDVNGPINDATSSCASYNGSTGEDGAIHNLSTDTCTLTIVMD